MVIQLAEMNSTFKKALKEGRIEGLEKVNQMCFLVKNLENCTSIPF